MRLVYFCAIFIPIILLGAYLVTTTVTTQTDYYSDLLESYNDGVSQTLYEITSQIYTISDSIVYNDGLGNFLMGEYENETQMRQAAADTTLLDKYVEKYAGVEEIRVYVDRPDMVEYGQFHKVTDEIRQSDWYEKAMNQYMPFWMAYRSGSQRGNNLTWNLTLVRKMILVGGGEAVIMIRVRDSYIGSRIDSSKYLTMVFVNDGPVAYSNNLSYCGIVPELPTGIDYDNPVFKYLGTSNFGGNKTIACINTMKIAKTGDKIYLLSYDEAAYPSLMRIIYTCALVLLAAIILPFCIISVFTGRFSGQVRALRIEMGKASRGEYREMSGELYGSEELHEAFEDLLRMVDDIQRMEAEQYEFTIRQQNIRNAQQQMEYKMLSSQINPHFLYNTLETIRMKAVTGGDREVANAIKLLGKSMRYVLDNTGMHDTTLEKEFDHVMDYLQIQKLRFGDRISYSTDVMDGLNMARIKMQPLLLQPIVENAIVHGLENLDAGGSVWISINMRGENLAIEVLDNGCGMSAEELDELRARLSEYRDDIPVTNIGLYNINRRIKLAYGEEYGLEIDSTPGNGTKVSVIIPVRN